MNYVPVKLPSRCKPYEGVNPDNIKIRSFLGKEELIISGITKQNYDKRIVELLESVLQGIDANVLTLGDRLYLLIWEAMNSYGDEKKVAYKCETCGLDLVDGIKLSEIENEEWPEDPALVYPAEITMSDGKKFTYRLLNNQDSIKISEWEAFGKNSHLYKYALSLSRSGMTLLEITNYLETVPSADLSLIRKMEGSFRHGPILEKKYVCKHCDSEGRIFLPFRLEFFS